MKVTLKAISANSFKNHHTIDLKFGVLNIIKGQNGEGKTTIGEIVSWVLFGTDMMGSKLDPTPQQGNADGNTWGAVLFDVDGKEIELLREIQKSKTHFEVNDVPKKATEFDEIVKSMFDKDLFLSLFNPSYFPALHWTKQREMVLSYVTPPAMKEVFATLPVLQKQELEKWFKQHNIDDCEAIHKKNKTQKEKDLIAAKSRVATLEESNTAQPYDMDVLLEHLGAVEKQISQAEEAKKAANYATQQLINKNHQLEELEKAIHGLKDEHTKAKNETECKTCGQPLDEQKRLDVLAIINTNYKAVVKSYKELKTEIEKMPNSFTYLDGEHLERVRDEKYKLLEAIKTERIRQEAVAKIEEAKANVEAVLASLNESVFLLDAIKAYRAKEAELQAKKVQDVFPTLTIRLYNVTKDGTENPTFEIEKDGKPYSKLSLGEKARAGLEVIGVLMEQSGVIVPVFVDNSESITKPIAGCVNENTNQVIAAYATPNQTLTMEVDN